MSDVTNLASKFGLKINENGEVSKIGRSIQLRQDEYLDYLKVKSELTDLKAKYEKALSALKFYGNKENWQDSGFDYGSGTIIMFDREYTSKDPHNHEKYGGKIARQTIAELGEI